MRKGAATRWKEFIATRSFRHFLAKMTPPSMREANISPVTAGTKAPHNQNTLTFEPNPPPFTAMTLTGQIIPALNFSRKFLRDLLGCGASQAGLAERGDLKLLSFALSFQKRKYKGKAFTESPSRRRLQTLTHLQIPPVSATPANACAFANPSRLPEGKMSLLRETARKTQLFLL